MMTLRKAAERGHADHGWLDSHHTFSFADYYDQKHMGFRALRVINDDRVHAGRGFGTHSHRDMEIISYVLEGELAHKDSMGTGAVILPGDVQRMSAGSGVTHSEMNPSKTQTVHFLQIWLLPSKQGIAPSYAQKRFSDEEKRGQLRLVASADGRDGSISIHTDASVYAGLFRGSERAELSLASGRHAWVHVARGKVRVGDHVLGEGDGLAISEERSVVVEAVGDGGASGEDGEVLVFDLA